MCLRTNHVQLLIERQTDSVGRVMHRLLTGYLEQPDSRKSRHDIIGACQLPRHVEK